MPEPIKPLQSNWRISFVLNFAGKLVHCGTTVHFSSQHIQDQLRLHSKDTIAKAAFLNRKTPLTQEEIDQWKHVEILIIDEISFMTVKMMKKLNTQLQVCRGKRNKPYGGLSVIFVKIYIVDFLSYVVY